MRALLLGSFVALAALNATAQSGEQEKVTIQFDTDRPVLLITYADGQKQTVAVKDVAGRKEGDDLSAALAVLKGYETKGWTLIDSESCTGVTSSHYSWVVGRPKR